MSDLRLIGDELHFDGQLVAVLVNSGTDATTLGAFTDGVEAGIFSEPDENKPCPECKGPAIYRHTHDCNDYEADEYDQAILDLVEKAASSARGGLISVTALRALGTRLIEEDDNEADASE